MKEGLPAAAAATAAAVKEGLPAAVKEGLPAAVKEGLPAAVAADAIGGAAAVGYDQVLIWEAASCGLHANDMAASVVPRAHVAAAAAAFLTPMI